MTVYELAVECGITTKVLEKHLWNLGVIVDDREAALEADVIAMVRDELGSAPADGPPPQPATPEPPSPDVTRDARLEDRVIRVYEHAARYKVDPAVILERLEAKGLPLRDHLAWMSTPHIEALEESFAADPPHAVETTSVSDVVKRRRKLR